MLQGGQTLGNLTVWRKIALPLISIAPQKVRHTYSHGHPSSSMLIARVDADHFTLASQLATLVSSLNCAAGMLKTKRSGLLPAKLLVVARLLHKSISQQQQQQQHDATRLERLGIRLGSLRQKLLRNIDRRLVRPELEIPSLVEDLTAFSLVTSSSPSDALTHFHHLRRGAIGKPRRQENQTPRDCNVNRLQLFLSTQAQSRNIFPDLMGASLRTISARPLLTDDHILAINDLRLDVHSRWFGVEIRNYTPWIRHDELPKGKAEVAVAKWTRETFGILVDTIDQDLSYTADISALAAVRRDVLQMWISSRQATRNLNKSEALSKIRTPYLFRLQAIAEQAGQRLHTDVDSLLQSILNQWDPTEESKAVVRSWDPLIGSMDMADGAAAFRQAIISTRTGRSEDVSAVLETLVRDVRSIEEAQKAIKAMRDVRWEDDYDDDSDDDDVANTTFGLLSRNDPRDIQDTLRSSTVSAVEALERGIEGNFGHSKELDCSSATSPGVFMIRLLRALRQKLPAILVPLKYENTSVNFCHPLVAKLHYSLAASVERQTADPFSTSLVKLASQPLRIHALWDGTPPLPVQISPATFKYLRSVVKNMETLGADLWTPDAVKVLKKMLESKVVDIIGNTVAAISEPGDAIISNGTNESVTNGDSEPLQDQQTLVEANTDGTGQTDQPATDTTDSDGDAETQPSKPDQIPAAADGQDSTVNADVPNDTDKPESPIISQEQRAESAEARRNKHIQLLFDVLYLQQVLRVQAQDFPDIDSADTRGSGGSQPSLVSVAAQLRELAGLGGDEGEASGQLEMPRLKKSADEYWRRTYLLFGLL